MSERTLADVGVIAIPRVIKDEGFKGLRNEQAGRVMFSFSTSYFWASFGSGTAYKHRLVVSVMAPDASSAEYEEYPSHWSLSYDDVHTVRRLSLGSGTLTVKEGSYRQNTLQEPSYLYFYVDPPRRLQIVWHAVKSEGDLDSGIESVRKMASSFRIVHDPSAVYAAQRDRPRKAADDFSRRLSVLRGTLDREGFGQAAPGVAQHAHGIYVETLEEPESRVQLVVPLGRVRIAGVGSAANRPRPVPLRTMAAPNATWNGAVGWRELNDEGQWEFSNRENQYLPFSAIGDSLAAAGSDRSFVYFYYASTLRTELAPESRLTTFKWFLDEVPEVRRLWREGKLIVNGHPEPDVTR